MNDKILTIGIPTYNRYSDLDKSLGILVSQAKEFKSSIAIVVADNASAVDNSYIINKYSSSFEIEYYRHSTNLGMDGNFTFLYEKCSTKYFWLLSDDDLLLPKAMNLIMNAIKGDEFGSLYLNNYWFSKEINWDDIKNHAVANSLVQYDSPLEYIERVNYWVTFISGNIINKDLVARRVDYSCFKGTLLSQLSWVIPAAFLDKPNIVIEEYVLACKADNTGGYKLFEVFGKNINFIMDFLIKKGYDKELKHIINSHLTKYFFPMFINRKNESFEKEKYLYSLLPIFWRYGNFWKYNFLPLFKQQLGLK